MGLAKKGQPRRQALEFAGQTPGVNGDRKVSRALLRFPLRKKCLKQAGGQVIDAVKAEILEGSKGD